MPLSTGASKTIGAFAVILLVSLSFTIPNAFTDFTVWHSQLPQWVKNINSASELTQVIQSHIATVMGRYRGKIFHWDVVNEVFEENGTFRNSVFYRLLGENFIDIAFRAARQADPNAKLYINGMRCEKQLYDPVKC